ncbi:hypothetical protein [Bacillus sp. T33-2]|uniref:hypothetical protein n=1 Tax=Bacillus sp. T33-2 TaxID=2054168 RepID=UPI000C78DEDD|nr:hypothetical protein [Bacillus sp. T33-2]PLR89486.1 hypothetical protein CVD19_23690 [Bacillus sp. T33-2]
MDYFILGLFCLSVLLFLVSFFVKDPYKTLSEEIDQLTIQQVQELYQIKKKLKVLEEELLVSDDSLAAPAPARPVAAKEIHDIIKNQVRSLSVQGKTVEQIARQSSLSVYEVEQILQQPGNTGAQHG